MTDGFPEPRPGRPIWLMTLADLALLLVGFMVLVHAMQPVGGKALARGFREGFGVDDRADIQAMPVAAAGLMDFAPGSAVLPAGAGSLVAWSREAVRDPRVTLTVTGSTDGSAADIDAASGSASLLAVDRARAVAVALSPVVPPGRLVITTAPRAARRAATVTLAFTGETGNSR